MDTVWSFSGDGLYGFFETMDLLPQWQQAGHVGVQINHCHLSVWMHLGRRAQKRQRNNTALMITLLMITQPD